MSDGNAEAGGSKGSEQQSQRVDIPDFLRPLFSQGADAATRTLGNVERLAGGDVVAGFDPAQEEAFRLAENVAGGEGDFISTFQNLLRDTAGGTDISSFLPAASFDTLSGVAGGSDITDSLPPEALSALSSTAGGDFLFGGDGFNAAVEAAVNAATPNIASAFGSTRGGLSGALAKQAVGDTAVDAFARQFANERSNQLGAAETLAGITGRDQDRSVNAAGLLGSFGDRERDRAISAGAQLPGAGLLSSNILADVGSRRQDQAQRELTGPLDVQSDLFSRIVNGIDFEQLLGQSGEAESERFSAGKS